MSGRGRLVLVFAVTWAFGAGTLPEAHAKESRDTTGVISGSVRVGKVPAAYANVIAIGTRQGTQTDERGGFVVRDLQPGRHTLRTQIIGAPSVDRSVHVAAGETTRVRITVPDPKDPRVIARYTRNLDNEALRRIRTSTTARLFLIDGQDLQRERWADFPFGPYRISRELPPPTTSVVEDITKLLGDPRSFDRRPVYMTKKMCSFNPGVGLTLSSPRGETSVLICLTCLQAVVRRTERSQRLDFDPVALEVRQWVTDNVGPVEQHDD